MTQAMNTVTDTTAKRKRGRPRGSRADVDILNAAAKSFGELGYERCKVENILKQAQVSRTQFYRFYRSKEQVFEILLKRNLNHVRHTFNQLARELEKVPVTDRLNKIIEKDVEMSVDSGPFIQVLLVEALHLNSYQSQLEESDRYFCELISQTIISMGHSKPDLLLLKALLSASRTVLVDVCSSDELAWEKKNRATQLIKQIMSVLLNDGLAANTNLS